MAISTYLLARCLRHWGLPKRAEQFGLLFAHGFRGFVHCLEAELKINIIRPLRADEGGNEMDFSRAGLNNRARARASARGEGWRRGSMTENVRSLVT